MAVDGGRLGRATNPPDNNSSHNDVKYCSWGMPWKGQLLFCFPFKEIQNLTGMVLTNNTLVYTVHKCTRLKGVFIIYGLDRGGVIVLCTAPL